jgi:hypothetical protein
MKLKWQHHQHEAGTPTSTTQGRYNIINNTRLVQQHQQHEAESINIVSMRLKQQHHQHEAETTTLSTRG